MKRNYVVALTPYLDRCDHPGGLTGLLNRHQGVDIQEITNGRVATISAEPEIADDLRREHPDTLDVFEDMDGELLLDR